MREFAKSGNHFMSITTAQRRRGASGDEFATDNTEYAVKEMPV
jgi:hypothetical protein